MLRKIVRQPDRRVKLACFDGIDRLSGNADFFAQLLLC